MKNCDMLLKFYLYFIYLSRYMKIVQITFFTVVIILFLSHHQKKLQDLKLLI